MVVIVLEGRERLGECLAALARQVGAPDLEIVVPVDDTIGNTDHLAFAPVRVERIAGRRTPAALRALGVERARGDLVALTEDHCTPSPEWCAEIVRAHEAPHAVIGGAVEKTEPAGVIGWALYFADYVRYLGPFDEGPAASLTDCNVSYKRAALVEVAGSWRGAFHEPVVHEAIRDRGGVLWRSPRIVVRQGRSPSWRDARRDRYAFGRLFGATRAEGQPLSRRLVWSAACAILPPLLVARSFAHVVRTRRLLAPFLRALPALVALDAFWAWGELVGSLTARAGALGTGTR